MPDTSGPGPVALQEPATWVYDFDPATGASRAFFNGVVGFVSGGGSAAGVASWNTRTGAVTMTLADVTGAGGAPLASPVFTGSPAAPTAAPGNNSTLLATTAFVQTAIASATLVDTFNGRSGDVVLTNGDILAAGGAPTASPALTGTPTAPTPIVTDISSQIATTQYVVNKLAAGAVTSWNGRAGTVTLTLSDITSAGGAPLASPNFTGIPAGPTAAPGTNTTQLASTAFVTAAVTASASGVASWNARTGAVTLQLSDVTAVGGAPLASPAFTGAPTAPTATGGDNSTKLATTAFVAAAIASGANVASWNGRTGAVTLQLADVTAVGGAALASPTFTGDPKAPTPTAGDADTSIATTAFVDASFAKKASPVFTGNPQAPTPATADNSTSLATTAFVKAQGYAPLASPSLTGTPQAPTATPGDSTQKLATTAFVAAAVAAATANSINRIIVQQFTTAGAISYPPSAGLLYAEIECVAGGGAGGSVATSSGIGEAGGGGGGGYTKVVRTAAQIGAGPISGTVGAGGTNGGLGNFAGNPGGATSLGSLCAANGGAGGGGAANSLGVKGAGGVAWASAVSPDLALPGGDGWSGLGAASATTPRGPLNSGGNAGGGMGAGATNPSNSSIAGSAGSNYGGGGAGAIDSGSGGAHTGGAGADGMIRIKEYCH